MKKLLPFASLFFLTPLLAARWPAQHEQDVQDKPAAAPQGDAQAFETRIAALESALATEKKKNDETRMLLDQALAYLDKQSRAAQAMLDSLKVSESQGFAVGENFHSRETLLAGMRAYWGEALTGIPKPPPTPAPAVNPAVPVRQRPPRQ